MRHTLIVIIFLAGVLIFGSCVPQKKVLLLQENPNVANQGNADKLLKTIPLQKRVYTLKPGDVLSLQVHTTTQTELNFLAAPPASFGATQDPILSGYTVDEEGNINLPQIGRIYLKGLSMAEAKSKITEAIIADKSLLNPSVNLRLLTFQFTVLGEVGTQGQYTTLQDNINVLEALSMAGGFTPFSNRGNIKLVRYEDGQANIYSFSMLDNNIIGKENFYLMPNDLIMIDPLPAKGIRENWIGSLTLGLSVLTGVVLIVNRLLVR